MATPNVLLVILDSVRAANTSLHGYRRDTTPFLDSFKEECTFYTGARAPSSWSLPSHVSLFTGYHVVEHGIVDKAFELRPGNTIWEELSGQHGYETGLFTDNHFVTRHVGALHEPFDHVDTLLHRTSPFSDGLDPFEYVGQYREFLASVVKRGPRWKSLLNAISVKADAEGYSHYLPSALRTRPLAEVSSEAFLNWEAEQSGPWAACINIMDSHTPYTPLPEFDEWSDERSYDVQRTRSSCRPEELSALEPLYDATIRQSDYYLERLIETLDERGELDDTYVVVTSDHGEAFGTPCPVVDDGVERFHGPMMCSESVLHVPLLVHSPFASPEVVDRPASITYFPQAVRRLLEPSADDESPYTAGPVLASSISEDLAADRPHARRTAGRIHVAYASDERERTGKIATQGQRVALESLDEGADTSTLERQLDETLSGLSDRSVCVETSAEDDELVEWRLRHLGYVD